MEKLRSSQDLNLGLQNLSQKLGKHTLCFSVRDDSTSYIVYDEVYVNTLKKRVYKECFCGIIITMKMIVNLVVCVYCWKFPQEVVVKPQPR